MTVIAKLSGGRDSSAMVLKMLENGEHIDEIIFSDTQQEFPEMYEYLDRFERYIKENYGKKILRLAHKRGESFEDWVFGTLKSGKLKGWVRGLPNITNKCYWQRESKSNPVDHWIKENKIENPTLCIGYTASESKRVKKTTHDNKRFPLIEYSMCEGDIDSYLESHNLVNPLYKHYNRTGCAMCPYQHIRGYFILYKKYPKIWEWMKNIEKRLQDIEDTGQRVINSQWKFEGTLLEIEQDFDDNPYQHDLAPGPQCQCTLGI